MKCPVCGGECLKNSSELLSSYDGIFKPCPKCRGRESDKMSAPRHMDIAPACSCGRRYIDDVFVHIFSILVEEGLLNPSAPLKSVGTPLTNPGFFMKNPPYLPENSLILISAHMTSESAFRIVNEVDEVKAVIGNGAPASGIMSLHHPQGGNRLLAGCDVRADIFHTSAIPIAVYKQQSALHVEYPRGYDPKILSVELQVEVHRPDVFVDAFCGAGTLGIVAGAAGARRIIMNDILGAAAYWSACNVHLNRDALGCGRVNIHTDYDSVRKIRNSDDPLNVADTTGGSTSFEIYCGSYEALHRVLPENIDLSVLDPFGKKDRAHLRQMVSEWNKNVGGEIFIP